MYSLMVITTQYKTDTVTILCIHSWLSQPNTRRTLLQFYVFIDGYHNPIQDGHCYNSMYSLMVITSQYKTDTVTILCIHSWLSHPNTRRTLLQFYVFIDGYHNPIQDGHCYNSMYSLMVITSQYKTDTVTILCIH